MNALPLTLWKTVCGVRTRPSFALPSKNSADDVLLRHHWTRHEHALARHWFAILVRHLGREQQYFDGGKTYKVTLPKGIPEAKFWSFTLYDNQTCSAVTRAGSQSYPSPAAEANADGSTTIYFSPTQPAGVKRGNWIQTMTNKGWFTILRPYSPLEPFLSKEWRDGEIELVPQQCRSGVLAEPQSRQLLPRRCPSWILIA